MKRAEFIRRMEEIAPPVLAEEFDEGRIGLLYEGKEDIVKIACALDATPNVAQKAADRGFDALVVHHPAFWNPMHSVTGRAAEILRPLAKADVNLYAMHTNFDHVNGGINDALAEVLGLTNRVRLAESPESLGVAGDLSMSFSEMAKALGCGLRVWGDISSVHRIAAAGGAAFDLGLIREAQAAGAEAFLASELKYSLALESPIPLIEATHYALEAPGMRALGRREGWTFIEGDLKTSIIE